MGPQAPFGQTRPVRVLKSLPITRRTTPATTELRYLRQEAMVQCTRRLDLKKMRKGSPVAYYELFYAQ
jgi:hypothetical protein